MGVVAQNEGKMGMGFRLLFLSSLAIMLLFSTSGLNVIMGREASVRPELKISMVGTDVEYLQNCLGQAGYLDGAVDGCFGPATQKAVFQLQKEAGLVPDGVVGQATWEVIEALIAPTESVYVVQPGETLWAIARQLDTTVSALADANGIGNPHRLAAGAKLVVPGDRILGKAGATTSIRMMHWDDVQRVFPKAATATILDLKSGLRFQIKRLFGTNHADVEPLTAADTRIMRRALGGKWSWDRRPIVVEVGNHRIAASMNGVPHGRSTIDNGFAGHFCLHFLGSRLHAGNRTDKDHQAAVLQAAGYGGR